MYSQTVAIRTSKCIKEYAVEREASYFSRTNWFIWIGFIFSVVMIAAAALTTFASKWDSTSLTFIQLSIPLGMIVALAFITRIYTRFKLTQLLAQTLTEKSLSLEGKITVWYTVHLFGNELFFVVAFVKGFFHYDLRGFVTFSILALAMHLTSLPNLTLRRPLQ